MSQKTTKKKIVLQRKFDFRYFSDKFFNSSFVSFRSLSAAGSITKKTEKTQKNSAEPVSFTRVHKNDDLISIANTYKNQLKLVILCYPFKNWCTIKINLWFPQNKFLTLSQNVLQTSTTPNDDDN